MEPQHQTVLLEEAVAALMSTSVADNAPSTYVDGTFGRGGHSARILEAMTHDDRLIAFDKDPEAAATAEAFVARDPRFQFIRGSFAALERIEGDISGVLLDLGVSSPQLDEQERGFSFLRDGPLDMRMDNSEGMSAADFVNHADESEIAFVLREFGEERFAKRIARAIVEARAEQPFTRTLQLASVVSAANPAWEKHKHPATRVFQAIRIHVNQELSDLEALLAKVCQRLRSGGRLVVISFHSLEDRRVKRFMRDAARGRTLPRGIPVTDAEIGRQLSLVGKAVRASAEELDANPRSRSAIMRVAEKL